MVSQLFLIGPLDVASSYAIVPVLHTVHSIYGQRNPNFIEKDEVSGSIPDLNPKERLFSISGALCADSETHALNAKDAANMEVHPY